jgi:hypothetical protein
VIRLGKSLLPEEIRGAYTVEDWHFPAWSKTLIEVLREFKLRKNDIARRTTATDYSRMNYEELRKIADNDPIADCMSNEEYESLSVEMWRKFSVENGLK